MDGNNGNIPKTTSGYGKPLIANHEYPQSSCTTDGMRKPRQDHVIRLRTARDRQTSSIELST